MQADSKERISQAEASKYTEPLRRETAEYIQNHPARTAKCHGYTALKVKGWLGGRDDINLGKVRRQIHLVS